MCGMICVGEVAWVGHVARLVGLAVGVEAMGYVVRMVLLVAAQLVVLLVAAQLVVLLVAAQLVVLPGRFGLRCWPVGKPGVAPCGGVAWHAGRPWVGGRGGGAGHGGWLLLLLL